MEGHILASKKKSTKPAAQQPKRKRIFTHARLVAIEALLFVGGLQVWFKIWLTKWDGAPDAAKIALHMLFMVGFLGFFVVYMERATKKSVATTHDVVRKVPFPVPLVLIHLAAFAGLYWFYGYVYGLDWFDVEVQP